ncbi:hypothetical protein WJX73_010527 [Symbiochloris irregularis]|uniref:alanine--glyoxylate transaminase n=1 Tax=Symbiochloris irregularis TaxID=706552 RepID=A0AAW1PBM3_9CHLO
MGRITSCSKLIRQLTHTSRGFASSSAAAQSLGRPGEVVTNVTAPEGPSGVLHVPPRLLMGPGPANSHPRVLAAQTLPLLGHMHPPFFKIMDEIQQGLRYVFQTNSKHVLMVSGTGHAGMEACIANLLEPGETIVVGNNGIWGSRVCDLAERYQAKVVNLQKEPGQTYSKDDLSKALEEHKPAVLFLTQGESSTGTHQNLAGVGELCRKHGTLLLVDTVCSLGGVPLFSDAWEVDAIYSGSQKCLAAPPGGAPLFFGERAFEKLQSRKSKVASYYFDLNLVGDYWGWYDKRFYHHTGMTSTWYGMREALALVANEGLDNMWARHQAVADHLWAGLRELNLEPFVEKPEDRLITVNTIKIPEGVDPVALVTNAMEKYNLEISGGLGGTVGKVWRVGLMGYNAKMENVEMVLAAFRDGLKKQGRL